MKLSIIIPVYNVAQWLPDTINSVLVQTFRDFELILVDDGSKDGSGELCDAFALADDRVRVIHQSNAGVSAARNAGLDAATGEFVGWVDSDDLIEADMYARLVAIAKNHDAQIAQCQHDRACVLNAGERSSAVTVMDGAAFVRRIFTKSGGDYTNQVSLCTKVFRRTLFDGIRFPVGQVYEDEMQTYKLCLQAEKIVETEDVLYHYVYRKNSIITGETPKKMLDKQQALLDRFCYLPRRLPELEKECAKSFLGYSERILCKLHDQGEDTSLRQALQVLLNQRKQLTPWLSRYERVYLHLLKWRWAQVWVFGNNFAPVQNVLAKVKRLLGM